jgi:hypothetical protein
MTRQALAAACVLAMASGVSRAQVVVNGGFETGNLTGWTSVGTWGVVSNASNVDAGSFSAGASSNGNTLSQTVTGLTPGGSYVLSFDYTNRDPNPSPTNDFSVQWNGVTVYSVTNVPAGTGSPIGYTSGSVPVTAPGVSSPLKFTSDEPVSFWLLDQVKLTAVPEPTTLALTGVAAVAGLWVRRRRAVATS